MRQLLILNDEIEDIKVRQRQFAMESVTSPMTSDVSCTTADVRQHIELHHGYLTSKYPTPSILSLLQTVSQQSQESLDFDRTADDEVFPSPDVAEPPVKIVVNDSEDCSGAGGSSRPDYSGIDSLHGRFRAMQNITRTQIRQIDIPSSMYRKRLSQGPNAATCVQHKAAPVAPPGAHAMVLAASNTNTALSNVSQNCLKTNDTRQRLSQESKPQLEILI